MWRNDYRSERGKFSTQAEWRSRDEAEMRAAYFLSQIAGERSAWARSVKYLGPQIIARAA